MSITKEEKARRDKLAEQGIRVCGKCKGEKPFDEFNKNKLKTYGLKNTCRSCEKQYTKENKEAIRDKDKKYYQENRGQVIDRQSQYGKKPEVIYRRNKRLRERRKNW